MQAREFFLELQEWRFEIAVTQPRYQDCQSDSERIDGEGVPEAGVGEQGANGFYDERVVEIHAVANHADECERPPAE